MVGFTEFKLSAFVDNVLFSLLPIQEPLPNLMLEFGDFEELSNFMINLTIRCTAIAINTMDRTCLEPAFPFKMVSVG